MGCFPRPPVEEEGGRLKITDKMRLDWLSRRKWEFHSQDCFQLYCGDSAYANNSLRKAIDDTIREAIRAEKKAAAKGD